MAHDDIERIDDELGAKLARYVAGDCSTEEAAEVHAWLDGDAGRAEILASLRKVWTLTGSAEAEWDADSAWDEVRERREARQASGQESAAVAARVITPDDETAAVAPVTGAAGTPGNAGTAGTAATAGGAGTAGTAATAGRQTAALRPRRSSSRWMLGAAAGVAIALAGAAMWMSELGLTTEEPPAVREYATGRAEYANLRLPDGTRVVLNVESRLSVPENYGSPERLVHLEGEALFEVQHDERRPFRVRTADIDIEDLGTVFGVRGYPDGSPVRVVVAEGLVDVTPTPPAGAEAESHRLEPGQLAHVAADGTVRVEDDVDASGYLAFAEGRLVFRNTPLRDVAAQLGRWYDLDVRLADSSLHALPLTASFEQEPVPSVLQLIALSLGLRYERDRGVVTFSR